MQEKRWIECVLKLQLYDMIDCGALDEPGESPYLAGRARRS